MASTPPIDVPALIAAMQDLVGKRQLTQAEIDAWWNGSPTGGPNGDGRYPMTNQTTGQTRLQPSPGLITAMASDFATWVFPDEFDQLAASGPGHDDTACLQRMFDQQLIDNRRPCLRPYKTYYLRGQLKVDPSRNSLEGNHGILNWSQRDDFVDPESLPDLTGGAGAMNTENAGAWTKSGNQTQDPEFNGSLVFVPPEGINRYLEIGLRISAKAGQTVRVRMKLDFLRAHTVGQNTFRDIGISFRRWNGTVAGSVGSGGNVGGSNWFYSAASAGYEPGVTVERNFTLTADDPVLRIQANSELSIANLDIKVVPDNSCMIWRVPELKDGGMLRGHNYRDWRNFKCVGRPGAANARFVDMWLFDTPLYATNDLGQQTRVNVYNVDISDGVGRGIVKKDRTYLSNFFGCRIVCAVAGIDTMEGTHDAGENIAFFGGNFGGGDISIRNRGAFELHFFGTSFDFSRQWYVGAGGALFFGCHFETNATSMYPDEPRPRIHLLSGHMRLEASKLQVNGSIVPNMPYPIVVEKNAVLSGTVDTAYNLHGTTGAIVGGEGRCLLDFKGGTNKEIDAILKRDAMHNVLGDAGSCDLGIDAIPIWARAMTEQGQAQLDRHQLGFPTNSVILGDVTYGSDIIVNLASASTGAPVQPTSAQVGAYIRNADTDAGTSIVEAISGQTITGSTSLGSSVITGVTPQPTAALVNGRYITGPGIPPGTRVIAYSNANSTVTLSRGANATAQGVTLDMGRAVRLSRPWTGATGAGVRVETTKPSAARAGVRIGTGGRSSDPCLQFVRDGIGNANLVYTLALPCEAGRAFGSELAYKVMPDATAPSDDATAAFYLQALFARVVDTGGIVPLVVQSQFVSDLPQTNLSRKLGTDWTLVRAATNRVDAFSAHDGYAPGWATHFIWTINLAGTPGSFDLRIDDIHGNVL